MEKAKREVIIRRPTEAREPGTGRVVWAAILIGIGVLFLAGNLGIISMSAIGAVFGALGGAIGAFFGTLGGLIGVVFGTLGRAIGSLWPLIIIGIGVMLLFRRESTSKGKRAPEDLE